MENNTMLKGTLFTLIAAAGFGAMGPAGKLIYKSGSSVSFMLAMRFLIAAVVLWTYIYVNRKKIRYRIDMKQMFVMFSLGGVFYFLTSTFYFNAITYIPVSIHVIIYYTYPSMVNIFSVAFLNEKLSLRKFISLLAAFAGILLIVSIPGAQMEKAGFVLSFLAAICNGSYVLMLGVKKIREVSSIVTAAYISTFSAISFMAVCIARSEVTFEIGFSGWLGIFFVAVVSTVITGVALSAGVKMIGASNASIISTFEPLEGVLLSMLILGETVLLKQAIGMILIIAAIVILNIGNNRYEYFNIEE